MVEYSTVYRMAAGSNPVSTAMSFINWRDNGGCLLALEVRGRRFESYSSDSKFLKRNKKLFLILSIALLAQLAEAMILNIIQV